MTVPFQRIDQRRDERLETFAADAIASLPEHHQRLGDGVTVVRWSGPLHRCLLCSPKLEKPNRMLAVVPRHGHELVQDAMLRYPGTQSIPFTERLHQLLTTLRAHLPLHRISSRRLRRLVAG